MLMEYLLLKYFKEIVIWLKILKIWGLSSLFFFFRNTWHLIIAPNHFTISINLPLKIWLRLLYLWASVYKLVFYSAFLFHQGQLDYFCIWLDLLPSKMLKVFPFWCLVHPRSLINNGNVNFQTLIKFPVSAFSLDVNYILGVLMLYDCHGRWFLRDLYFAIIAMDGQLLLNNNNYNNDNDYDDINKNNINKK